MAGHTYNKSVDQSSNLDEQINPLNQNLTRAISANYDMAIAITIQVSEAKSLELRLEAFNVSNDGQFYGPAGRDAAPVRCQPTNLPAGLWKFTPHNTRVFKRGRVALRFLKPRELESPPCDIPILSSQPLATVSQLLLFGAPIATASTRKSSVRRRPSISSGMTAQLGLF